MDNKTNALTAKIVDYRFIGKTQLNADDMGGVGCSTWEEYLRVCSLLSVAAWNHTIGKSNDDTIVENAISGILDFFGISVVDTKKYTARILSVLVERKAKRSDTLKDAIKEKNKANKAMKAKAEALRVEGKTNDEITADEELIRLTNEYNVAKELVDSLYLLPNHYWFDPTPTFNEKTLKAKESARKALEDTCADIFTERQFMSAEEIQREKIALKDQRKGREAREKKESKAQQEKAEVRRAVMDELQERGVEVDG